MAKIAFLIGVPGSGKGTLTDILKQEGLSVITGDHVIHWTSSRLCPFLEPDHQWAESFWASMIEHCDIRPAMRRVLIDVFKRPKPPFILEANLFAIAGVRSAFLKAMKDIHGSDFSNRVFWLDIDPAENVRRVKARIESNRPWEQPISLAEAERRRRFIADNVASDAAIVDNEPTALTAKIRDFLTATT